MLRCLQFLHKSDLLFDIKSTFVKSKLKTCLHVTNLKGKRFTAPSRKDLPKMMSVILSKMSDKSTMLTYAGVVTQWKETSLVPSSLSELQEGIKILSVVYFIPSK